MPGPQNLDVASWLSGIVFSIFITIFIVMFINEDSVKFKTTSTRKLYRGTYITAFILTLTVIGVIYTW